MGMIQQEHPERYPTRRDGEMPGLGDPNEISPEALDVALATMLDPECGPQRAWHPRDAEGHPVTLEQDFARCLARMPAPPGPAEAVPPGLASRPDQDRLDLMEGVLTAQWRKLGELHRWVQQDLQTTIYRHLAHLEAQRKVDLLNQPTDARITHLSHRVFHAEYGEAFRLRDDLVRLIQCADQRLKELQADANRQARG